MELPYNLIHQLENQFGSLNHVPESNLILKKIRQLIFAAEAESKRVSLIKDEKLVADMLNEGYGFDEIVGQIGLPIKKVRYIAKKLHISAKPHFKYKVTVSKTGQLIYSGNYRNYGMLMHHGCDCFEYTRRYLKNEGYKLERLPELMPWRKLENGDQYISHRRIITKGLD